MKEQELIDICFQLVLTCLDKKYVKNFIKMSQEQKAEWVAAQLKGCGFSTHPCGSSWGILDKENK